MMNNIRSRFEEINDRYKKLANTLLEIYKTNTLPGGLQKEAERVLLETGVLAASPQNFDTADIHFVCSCGSHNAEAIHNLIHSWDGMDEKDSYYIECKECSFRTASYEDFHDAIEEWIKILSGKAYIATPKTAQARIACGCGANDNIKLRSESIEFIFDDAEENLEAFAWEIECGHCKRLVRGRIKIEKDCDITDALILWLEQGNTILFLEKEEKLEC